MRGSSGSILALADPGHPANIRGRRGVRKRLLVAAALAAELVMAGTVRAQAGLNMIWDQCLGDATTYTLNRSFACDLNTGSVQLVCSVVPPASVPSFSGAELFVDLITQASPLPDWWRYLNVGTCRQSALSVNFNYSGAGTGCHDAWQGSGIGGLSSYGNPYVSLPTITPDLSTQYATIDLAGAIAGGGGRTLDAGTEYFLANIVIQLEKSTGAGACTGCSVPACISFTRLLMSQAGGGPDVYLSTPGTSSIVTWQGTGANCFAVPARHSTWGALKSLYR